MSKAKTMPNIITDDITGVEISYYFICKKKLWLFSHNIQMEHTSEAVQIGAKIHEDSYKRKRKEITLGRIKLDFIEPGKGLIHEVKKSKAVENAHLWQLKYYLYKLKQLGLDFNGKIDYPLIRRTENVYFEESDKTYINNILKEIESIKCLNSPPEGERSGICKKCSYYEYCFV